MKIVLITPTYDEAGNIEELIRRVEEVFHRLTAYHLTILVVDDSSPDGTGKIVERLKKKFTNLFLIENPRKVGLGGAYLEGMKWAFDQQKADAVFQIDADLSHDISKIPLMLDKLDQGYDLVLGSRYIPGGGIPEDWGILRRFLSIAGNLTAMILMMNFTIHDWTGGFRLTRRWVYERYKNKVQEYRNYTFQISTLYWAVRSGAKVAEVPFVFVDRWRGKSKMPKLDYIIRTLWFIVAMRTREVTQWKFFRFGVVGFSGYLVAAVALWILGHFRLPEVLIWFLATELSIISNFIWNNLWTFAEQKFTKTAEVILKFLQFNATSAVAVVILSLGGTFLSAHFGTNYRQVYLPLLIVFIVLPYNWLAYTRIVWKGSSKERPPVGDGNDIIADKTERE
jgi:dolichol-phosphate mannosyltransferase